MRSHIRAQQTGSEAMTPLAAEILSIMPELRRYSFALIGDRQRGDRYIEVVLETLLQEPTRIRRGDDVRFKLYDLFHDVIARFGIDGRNTLPCDNDPDEFDELGRIRDRVLDLPLSERKMLLLTLVEGFSLPQAAALAELSLMDASLKTGAALRKLSYYLAPAAAETPIQDRRPELMQYA
jgi:DNA-directed RNA polymerase specialized sigma24 family protein